MSGGLRPALDRHTATGAVPCPARGQIHHKMSHSYEEVYAGYSLRYGWEVNCSLTYIIADPHKGIGFLVKKHSHGSEVSLTEFLMVTQPLWLHAHQCPNLHKLQSKIIT